MTDWNEVFLRAVRSETTPPPLAARNLAILHVAVYDAVNAITRTHQPYCFEEKTSVECSLEAAAASAAHRVAGHLYPSRKADFDSFLAKALDTIADNAAKTNGIRLGEKAAAAILALRSADGASTTVPYVPSDKPGRWRRTPPYFRPPELPQWRFVKPFTLTNLIQFRPPPPPSLDSERWAHDLEEVRRLGAKESEVRTLEQAEIARFWSDFSYTTTPPGHWNEIARSVALEKELPLEDSARLFAILNLAMADAAIVCWDAKYEYDFWRPVTAIREADRDGNPADEQDFDWLPLLATPAHPEYPSGHSTFSGAAAAVLAGFFGAEELAFTVTSDSLPGVERKFSSFSQVAEEIGRSRIYGGIHFSSADIEGRKAGRTLGEYVVRNCLLSVK